MRDIDPQNDLTFLRIRSKKNEIMVAPGEAGAGQAAGHAAALSSWEVAAVSLRGEFACCF